MKLYLIIFWAGVGCAPSCAATLARRAGPTFTEIKYSIDHGKLAGVHPFDPEHVFRLRFCRQEKASWVFSGKCAYRSLVALNEAGRIALAQEETLDYLRTVLAQNIAAPPDAPRLQKALQHRLEVLNELAADQALNLKNVVYDRDFALAQSR